MTSIFENKQNHGSWMLPWHTFFLLAVLSGLFVFGGPAPEVLVFDRLAVTQGEFWRLFTGHWVHADTEHLAWNLVAFGIVGWMIETSLGPSRLYGTLISGMCLVIAWLWLFVPTLDFYCGLSGVLNTLLFVILIDGWLRTRKPIFPLVFVAAMAKITFELFQSSAIFTHTSWPSIPEAHLAGALAAVLFSAERMTFNKVDSPKRALRLI